MAESTSEPRPGAGSADATRSPVPVVVAAAGGIASAAAGLGAATAVAGLHRTWQTPVVSVGDRVIDRVPTAVKDWAIATFGTNDKMALVVGTLVVLGVVAAGLGVLVVRRGRLGPALSATAALVAIGATAAVAGPRAGLGAAAPAIVGGVVAAALLATLHRGVSSALAATARAPAGAGDPRPVAPAGMGPSRRGVLFVAGAGALIAATSIGLGQILRQRFEVTAERLAVVLPRARRPLPPAPGGFEAEIPGISPLIVPNDRFYRIDTALVVPSVSIGDWTLRVSGMVGRELELDYAELLDRDLVEADVTLACVSNEIGGRLVGNARWLGCRVDDLLAEAGVDPQADQVLGRSVDGFSAGFPVAALDGRPALVAVAMNGEPLPVEHGYPARLVVPGLYGYVSATKWLREIELTRFGRDAGYWIPRGWSVEGPIRTQSRIDVPNGEVTAGVVAVAGVAWAGERGVTRVEVRVDDGPWREARLGPELATTSWRQWHLPWDATPGRRRLTVRATDGTGSVQTDTVRPPAPSGATGQHSVTVTVV